MIQGLQSELPRKTDERTAAVFKLEARVNAEHRFTETAVSAETKAREDIATIVEEAFRQRIGEKARRPKLCRRGRGPDHDTF